MNRTDAAAILNVDPSASPEEARRAYQELFTEHQVRLTNAPTPALRSLYQTRLKELDEARDVILATSPDESTFDLPTDQPSIPSPVSYPPTPRPTAPPAQRDPLPPPPRQSQQPAQSRTEQKPATTAAEASPTVKKSGKKKWIIGLVVLMTAYAGFRAVAPTGNGGDGPTIPSPDTTASTDSVPALRENVTVARVEFGRGDYDAANTALADADRHYAALSSVAKSDTAVSRLKDQLDQLHTKVSRACDALKKVAERHPGEPTCKPI